MIMSFHTLNCSSLLVGNINKNRTMYRTRSNPFASVQPSSNLVQTHETGSSPESRKIKGSSTPLTSCIYQTSTSLLSQSNTVGIIGGVSVFSTLIFLEKLVWWSSRDGEECLPFVVCSDPALNRGVPFQSTYFPPLNSNSYQIQLDHASIVENLRHKREFLEQSGARCIVMPCHLSHAWHGEVSEGCSLPFLHVGECVAKELMDAKLRPIAAGSDVRIGVLGTYATLKAGFYQEKLQNQGFEVVLPDKATMEHMVIPAIESLNRKDIEGARNLLRVAIQVLLVRAVNTVILASDEMLGLLPHDDPLLKKCIDPMDALARSTIKWAQSARKVHQVT